MPVPTAYTEQQLAVLMRHLLGGTADDALGWVEGTSDAGDYAEPVVDALLLYGVTTIAAATDVGRLRAAARVAVWRAAMQALADRHQYSLENDQIAIQQHYDHAEKQAALAEADAMAYGLTGGATVTRTTLRATQDPYAYIPENEWAAGV
jgi:hypothetical protein